MKVKHVTKQFIHLLVEAGDGKTWEWTVGYASPNYTIKKLLWRDLELIEHNKPWCLLGDFNATLFGHERSTGGGGSPRFFEMVESQGLLHWILRFVFHLEPME